MIGGDHGEAFGEHGQLAHGFSVYDEEVHIPLLIVNRKMFPQPRVVNSLARQIDIAPTLLDLLGIAEPAQWQGQSLLSGPPPARAYMFASDSDFRFGLIEGNEKYIYNYDSNRSELYDLATDPKERHDLAAIPPMPPRSRRRICGSRRGCSFRTDGSRSSCPPRLHHAEILRDRGARKSDSGTRFQHQVEWSCGGAAHTRESSALYYFAQSGFTGLSAERQTDFLRQRRGHANLRRCRIEDAADRIEIVRDSIAGKRLDDHPGAVRFQAST